MDTRVINMGQALKEAVAALGRGDVVAVPTETVYGLAAAVKNPDAVVKIFSLKGRPEAKALPVLVSDFNDVKALCRDVPEAARLLADKFWPGPLTLVMKKADDVPDIVTAKGDTIGVRCPDCAPTLELIRKTSPLAAPSANISDMPSAVTPAEVLQYFGGKIPVIVDGGKCALGIESTVLDLTAVPPRILRRGAVSKLSIKNVIAQMPSGVTMLGITGPTGSGKTTALRALRELGAAVIDCDALYHDLLRDAGMLGEIEARFGGVVKNGELDRKALGAVVFSDAEALSDLNAITHKHVDREIFRVVRGLEAVGGSPVVAVDAIALIESGFSKLCDNMTAVIASKELRIGRIMARDGIDYEYASARVSAQKPDEFYKNNCDSALLNDGDEKDFYTRCIAYFEKVLEDFK